TFAYTPASATTGATFTWTRAAVTNINGGASGSGSTAVSETLTNSSSAPINVTYAYTTLANGCSTNQNVVVTVNPIPGFNSPGSITAICSGALAAYTPSSLTSGATFTWTRAAVAGITPTGPASGIGSISETLNNA